MTGLARIARIVRVVGPMAVMLYVLYLVVFLTGPAALQGVVALTVAAWLADRLLAVVHRRGAGRLPQLAGPARRVPGDAAGLTARR